MRLITLIQNKTYVASLKTDEFTIDASDPTRILIVLTGSLKDFFGLHRPSHAPFKTYYRIGVDWLQEPPFNLAVSASLTVRSSVATVGYCSWTSDFAEHLAASEPILQAFKRTILRKPGIFLFFDPKYTMLPAGTVLAELEFVQDE